MAITRLTSSSRPIWPRLASEPRCLEAAKRNPVLTKTTCQPRAQSTSTIHHEAHPVHLHPFLAVTALAASESTDTDTKTAEGASIPTAITQSEDSWASELSAEMESHTLTGSAAAEASAIQSRLDQMMGNWTQTLTITTTNSNGKTVTETSIIGGGSSTSTTATGTNSDTTGTSTSTSTSTASSTNGALAQSTPVGVAAAGMVAMIAALAAL
ncbi:hypothetical protein N7462_007151 [Penicillium macrosclerotiorum]|uniref:uncharacterized protein n=1 Tax=Penicillium macrosclerotiorum TaxID=303699 RepID=UPI002548F065|nr:uncharacterized protein N7462_007151 [Penicillium macrosclerotiorum]KAJ5678907.1 hypothetical protein N7462_007151 [Penicillium macrosclerotiorum]